MKAIDARVVFFWPIFTFSAFTLLVRHLVCWLGIWCVKMCVGLFVSSDLTSIKSRMETFLVPANPGSPGKMAIKMERDLHNYARMDNGLT